ncbi:hypothetical protein Lser_V15G26791 [Lactuca serriola]
MVRNKGYGFPSRFFRSHYLPQLSTLFVPILFCFIGCQSTDRRCLTSTSSLLRSVASDETSSSQVLLHLTFNDSPTTYLHLLLPPTDSSIFNIRLVTVKTQKPLTTTALYAAAHNQTGHS